MLTFQSIKKSVLFIPLSCFALFSLVSCGKNEVDSKQVATELNKPKSDATKERDERFLVNAAEINFEEIMLGKMAEQRSMSDDVKELARMLQESHRTARTELNGLALTKSIAVPTAATKNVMEDYDKLNLAAAKEFDQEYCSMVVQSHKDAISTFESYTQGQCDPDIKVWALGMIPNMRIHLEKAMEIEALMKNPVSELITESHRVRI